MSNRWYSAKRWLTGLLATALVATSIPAAAFGAQLPKSRVSEEQTEEEAVVEEAKESAEPASDEVTSEPAAETAYEPAADKKSESEPQAETREEDKVSDRSVDGTDDEYTVTFKYKEDQVSLSKTDGSEISENKLTVSAGDACKFKVTAKTGYVQEAVIREDTNKVYPSDSAGEYNLGELTEDICVRVWSMPTGGYPIKISMNGTGNVNVSWNSIDKSEDTELINKSLIDGYAKPEYNHKLYLKFSYDDATVKSVKLYYDGESNPIGIDPDYDNNTYLINPYYDDKDWGEVSYIEVETAKKRTINVAVKGASGVYYFVNYDGYSYWCSEEDEGYPDSWAFDISAYDGDIFKIDSVEDVLSGYTDEFTVKSDKTQDSEGNFHVNSDFSVDVRCVGKPGVSVNTIVDGSAYSAKSNATVSLCGVDKNNKSQNEAILVTVSGNKGRDVYKVSYQIKDGAEKKIGSGNGTFEIPVSVVNNATEEDKPISIKILTVDSSKGAVYEPNLKLKKINSTFTSGQKNVEIAEVQFTADTTEKDISYAKLTVDNRSFRLYDPTWGDYDENINNDRILQFKNGKIIALDTSPMHDCTGKGTLTVTAKGDEEGHVEPSKASLKVNVKQGIFAVNISGPQKVYKTNKKATAKFTAELNGNYSNRKPASKKLIWTVVRTKDNKPDTLVTVKNGKVTIDKDFTLSSNEADNQFRVSAMADDYKGSEVGESFYFTITAKNEPISNLVLIKDYSNPSKNEALDLSKEYSSYELEKYHIAALDSKGNRISTNDYNLSYDLHSIYLSNDSYYNVWYVNSIEKPGKCTITAKSLDGKSSKKITLKVKNETVSQSGLNIYDDESDFDEYLSSRNKSISCNNYYCKELTVDAYTDVSGVTNSVPVVKIKSGAIVTQKYKNKKHKVKILPTARQTVIEVTCGKKSVGSYTINNLLYSNDSKKDVKINPDSNALYVGRSKTVNIKISANELDDPTSGSGDYVLRFIPTDNFKWSKYKIFFNSAKTYRADNTEDGAYNFEIYFSDTSGIKPGEYKIKTMICRLDYTKWEYYPVTATKELTFTVKKVPKITLTNSYKIAATDKEVKLKFGKISDADTKPRVINLYNNNNKKAVNNFCRYFDFRKDEKGEYYLVLKSGVTADKIPAQDLVGWVKYGGESSVGRFTTGKKKITIKVK